MEKKSKTVNMSGAANGKKDEKLTYEQLEQVAGNLNQRCNMLYQQLQQAKNTIAEFNEIGLLLDVIKQSEQFSPQFAERCSKKIEELITKALDESEKQPETQEPNEN